MAKTISSQASIKLGNAVMRAASSNDWVRALDVCQQWICADPENADGFFWLSSILLNQGKNLAALKASQTSVFLARNDPRLLTQLAKCYLLVKNDKDANTVAKLAVTLAPKEPSDLDTLGTVLSHLGEHDQAVKLFRKAVAKSPDNSQFHSNLGSSLNFCNESTEAEAAFHQSIALDPDNYRAHWSISQLRKQSSDSNHIETLTDLLLRPGLNETAEMYLALALSKEYEDIGQYETSFRHLTRGNRIVLRKYPYDEKADIEYFDNLLRIFDASFFERSPKGFCTSAPIFIIGLPRTGTTLLEQMLGEHSEVFAAGELHTFKNEFSKISVQEPDKVVRSDWQANIGNIDFEKLGRNYIENIRYRVEESRVFTDKYPLNYELAGAIGLALPQARIIHLTRNPMDTCFSNFKQLFSLGSCRYSYDLESMGNHYLRYRILMAHWHQSMPGRILDVAYEDLVTETEASVRRVLNYCGLRWEDRCLEFHNSTRNIATASTAQVRRPIHRQSIGRWKQHVDSLSVLIELFRGNDIAV